MGVAGVVVDLRRLFGMHMDVQALVVAIPQQHADVGPSRGAQLALRPRRPSQQRPPVGVLPKQRTREEARRLFEVEPGCGGVLGQRPSDRLDRRFRLEPSHVLHPLASLGDVPEREDLRGDGNAAGRFICGRSL